MRITNETTAAKNESKWKAMPELMLRYRAMEIINKRLAASAAKAPLARAAARASIGQD
jgi:hypothetical protein